MSYGSSAALYGMAGALEDVNSSQDALVGFRDKESYDSGYEVYLKNVGDYNTYLEDYNDAMSTSRALDVSWKDTTSNGKDRNEHLAGGNYGINGSLPGSPMWSPTATAKMTLDSQPVNNVARLVSGNLLGFLGYGFGSIQAKVMGGALDLMFEGSTSSRTFSLEITLGDMIPVTKYFTIHMGKGEGRDRKEIKSEYNGEYSSPVELNDMMNSSMTKIEMLAGATGVRFLGAQGMMVGVVLTDILTGDTEALRNNVGKHVVNEFLGLAGNAVAKGLISTLGITAVWATIAIGITVSTILSEVFQRVMGLDNYAGFGGGLKGEDQFGKAVYGRQKSFTQGLSELMPDYFRESMGLDLEDYITKLEDSGSTFGLTNSLGVTSLYSYNTSKGETTDLEKGDRISKKKGYWDTGKEDLQKLLENGNDPFKPVDYGFTKTPAGTVRDRDRDSGSAHDYNESEGISDREYGQSDTEDDDDEGDEGY